MKVVGRDRLDAFASKYADSRGWIESWLSEVEAASCASPADVRKRYSTVSFLAGNTVIFNVRGNNYRLEVTVAYKAGVIAANWIGTHAEYDRRNSAR